MKAYRVFVLIMLCALFVGCAAKGPIWKQEVSFPNPTTPLKGRKIIVARFLASPSDIAGYLLKVNPQECRPNFEKCSTKYMMESDNTLNMPFVQDISPKIVSELDKLGIAAEARTGAKPSDIKGEEVLFRGAILVWPRGSYFSTFLTSPLACVLFPLCGRLFPSPIPATSGANITCRLELIDSSGNILSQIEDGKLIGLYESRWVWNSEHNILTAAEKISSHIPGKIAEILGKILR